MHGALDFLCRLRSLWYYFFGTSAASATAPVIFIVIPQVRHRDTTGMIGDNIVSKYYNPPREIEDKGRVLDQGSFEDLRSQLRGDEVLFARYMNQQGGEVALLLESQELLDDIMGGVLKEKDGSSAPVAFFALDQEEASQGLRDQD